MTRAAKVATIRCLQRCGLTHREIAAEMGWTISTVRNLLFDPDGSKQRARRRRYQGECVDCGAPTDGSNGRAFAPQRCRACNTKHQKDARRWTQGAVIAALQAWAKTHGKPPTSADWIRSGGDEHPARTTVYASNEHYTAPFPSWAAAVEAAGFPRPKPGRPTRCCPSDA